MGKKEEQWGGAGVPCEYTSVQGTLSSSELLLKTLLSKNITFPCLFQGKGSRGDGRSRGKPPSKTQSSGPVRGLGIGTAPGTWAYRWGQSMGQKKTTRQPTIAARMPQDTTTREVFAVKAEQGLQKALKSEIPRSLGRRDAGSRSPRSSHRLSSTGSSAWGGKRQARAPVRVPVPTAEVRRSPIREVGRSVPSPWR